MRTMKDSITDNIQWNGDGLVPAIAQDWQTGEILMLAWMNAEALRLTVDEGRAIYWSRSRSALWRKGEESGNVQLLKELRIDCDADTVLMKVEQIGEVACHTGRRSCFYLRREGDEWQITDPVLRDPASMYGDKQ